MLAVLNVRKLALAGLPTDSITLRSFVANVQFWFCTFVQAFWIRVICPLVKLLTSKPRKVLWLCAVERTWRLVFLPLL